MKYQTATQWGVYEVEVEAGRIVGVNGISGDPDPSAIGQLLVDGIQHKARIDQPYIRKGWLAGGDRNRMARGNDEFVAVSWDEALELAGLDIKRVADTLGNTSIFAGSYGWASAGRFHHAQSQLHRFINLVGGSTRAMNSYSTAAAQVILPHVVAPWHEMEIAQPAWPEIAQHTKMFVAFGGIPLRNTQVSYGGITEHQTKSSLREAITAGVRFVNISPIASDAPEWLNAQWIAYRPGTDVAFMLALAYVLETQGLADRSFLSTHAVGYEIFCEYLLGKQDGQPKSPQWAQSICNIDARVIENLATQLVEQRTFLSAAWSLQRAHHGEQPYWMLVTLAAMLGQIGLPGGGFGFGYGAEGFIGSAWRRFNWTTLSKGRNPTGFAIPVARIADMLLNPGETIHYDGQEIKYPEIDLIYWAGGNPFHHHQDLNRLVTAWRKPSTVIVNEPWWTPVAKWADIVFPATTALEREDICASSHDPYAHFMQQAIEPQHDARSDHEIFTGLAKVLGLEEAFTEGRSPSQWLEHMWYQSAERAKQQGFELPSFAKFRQDKQYRIPEAKPPEVWLAAFRSDTKKNSLSTPSGRIEIYSEAIAEFDYTDCPAHPTWMEPAEWLGGGTAHHYPLALLSPQPERRLHSQLDHAAYSQAGKINGKEVLTMHSTAAAARGIKQGDTARVFNDRGACLVGVWFDDLLLVDVVLLPTGAWFKPDLAGNNIDLELNGNPNVLTLDIGTSSLAQGPSANTCLVEVERYTQ